MRVGRFTKSFISKKNIFIKDKGSDVKSDIDEVNKFIDNTDPVSSSEDAAVRLISSKLNTLTSSISNSISTLFEDAPKDSSLDEIDKFLKEKAEKSGNNPPKK